MDIQDQVVRFRYYILASLLSLIAIFTLLHLAPSFVTLIVFFFPLLISTTIFLTIIILFGNTTQSHPNDAVPSFPKPAEELLDYVAGNHHPENPSDDNSEWKELPLKGEDPDCIAASASCSYSDKFYGMGMFWGCDSDSLKWAWQWKEEYSL